jgi:tRNA A37 threonylcarbamoyltransferase TsaD
MKYAAEEKGAAVHFPPLKHCGDSAAYIASAAFFDPEPKPLEEIVANPSLGILEI